MITVNPLALPSNRRRDGTIPVYVRVYYATKSRRIPTNVVCYPSDLTRSGRIKTQGVLDAVNLICARMRNAVSNLTPADLEGRDVDWVVDRIRCADRLHTFKLDFFVFADELIRSKTPGARGQYITACNVFSEYLGKREIDVNDITRPLLQGFLSWMRDKVFCFRSGALSPSKRCRIPNGAESRDMAKLAHIFGKAKDRYND